MSAFGDALSAIRSVLIMQANVERLEKNVDQLGKDQGGFREALFALDRRLVRVETIIETTDVMARQAPMLPRE